jgi:trehalose 6-phosphate phosphatase
VDPAAAPLIDGDPAGLAVLVDFDGSLSPIVDDPAAAVALPEAVGALRALAGRIGLVAVVSGRPVEFLLERIGIDGIRYVGQYGLEWVDDLGRVQHDARADASVDAVATVASEANARFPDLLVERKGRLAVGLHWRTSDEMGDEVARWAAEAGARLGLAVHESRKARELRPALAVDKGTAVRALIERAPGIERACFAGDDRGDLAAFDALTALRAEGRLRVVVRIGIDSGEAPPELLAAADLVVAGPKALAGLLAELAAAIS